TPPSPIVGGMDWLGDSAQWLLPARTRARSHRARAPYNLHGVASSNRYRPARWVALMNSGKIGGQGKDGGQFRRRSWDKRPRLSALPDKRGCLSHEQRTSEDACPTSS